MQNQTKPDRLLRRPAIALSAVCMAVLAGCANYAGMHSDRQMIEPDGLATTQSLPAEQGRWPAAGWDDQFGDAQLKTLIDEALQGSPSLEMARARVAAAAAASEGANANTLPQVSASYSINRQRFSETALVPPPYAGAWQTENKAAVSASYDLDLWGKNREALKSSVSALRASEAETEQIKLTLSTAIARAYNDLARLYALRDIAADQLTQRQQVLRLTQGRVTMGLDTDVEKKGAEADVASAEATIASLDGSVQRVRYQLGALLGKGPDRGLAITRPTLGVGDTVALPDNLPADLVSRRPDLVAARWRVDASTHDIAVAKADFYPDINLAAAIGLDAFGFGRFLTAASRTANVGPAIHLPIFDGGALRAQLKGRYADFDYAVAHYNDTLVNALSDVATQLSEIRSVDNELAASVRAQDAARRALQLALAQYKGGLTTQLTVLHAQANALTADQQVASLRMARRDHQIALASTLGGGYQEAPQNTQIR